MPPPDAPHLEDIDLQPETQAAADRLRASAVRAEQLQPALDRLKTARLLLQEIAGFVASRGIELPLEVDQKLTAWLHEDVMARKEQQL